MFFSVRNDVQRQERELTNSGQHDVMERRTKPAYLSAVREQ